MDGASPRTRSSPAPTSPFPPPVVDSSMRCRPPLRATPHRKHQLMTTTFVRSALVVALAMLVWSPPLRAESTSTRPRHTQSADFSGADVMVSKEVAQLFAGATFVRTQLRSFAPPPPLALPLLTNRPEQDASSVARYTFDDVYFDLDGFTPRSEAMLVLDDAARAMLAEPTFSMAIEGHTCDIGMADHNVALALRRANAVRDYLVGPGIAVTRLRTASYGEEDPEQTRPCARRGQAPEPPGGAPGQATAMNAHGCMTTNRLLMLSLGVALAISACGTSASDATDTSLNPEDGAAAGAPSQAAAATAGPRTVQALTPPPREVPQYRYRDVTIPSGTTLPLTLTSDVASDTNVIEDAVTADLTRAITIDGRDVLPAGARLAGIVTEVDDSGRVRGRAMIAFRFTSLWTDGQQYHV